MACCIRSSLSLQVMHESHVGEFFRNSETQYKLVRAADPVFDTIKEIAKASNASKSTLQGISFGRATFHTMRDVLGIIRLITNVIPSLFYALKLLWDLIWGIIKGNDVPLKPVEEIAYNEIATNNIEKYLLLGAVSAKFVKSLSSTFTFTVCKPILYLETTGSRLSNGAHMIGSSYQTIMAVKYASGFLGIACEMSYQYIAYERAQKNGENLAYETFSAKMSELTVDLIEKSLQLIYHTAKILTTVVPPAYRLPLTFTISGIGLYKVWLKTS